MLIFVEGGKPENPEKNPRSKDENQQQTQPTYGTGSLIRTRATLVGGERDHHCAIPAPHAYDFRPNCTPLSSITIIYITLWQLRVSDLPFSHKLYAWTEYNFSAVKHI